MDAEKKPGGSRTWIGILLGAMALVVVGAALSARALVTAGPPKTDPAQLARTFFEAMSRDDWAAAGAVADPALGAGLESLGKARPEVWAAKPNGTSVNQRGGLRLTWSGFEHRTVSHVTWYLPGRDGTVRTVTLIFTGQERLQVREVWIDTQQALATTEAGLF